MTVFARNKPLSTKRTGALAIKIAPLRLLTAAFFLFFETRNTMEAMKTIESNNQFSNKFLFSSFHDCFHYSMSEVTLKEVHLELVNLLFD